MEEEIDPDDDTVVILREDFWNVAKLLGKGLPMIVAVISGE